MICANFFSQISGRCQWRTAPTRYLRGPNGHALFERVPKSRRLASQVVYIQGNLRSGSMAFLVIEPRLLCTVLDGRKAFQDLELGALACKEGKLGLI